MTPRPPSSNEPGAPTPVQLPLFQTAPASAGARLARRIRAWLACDEPSQDDGAGTGAATQPASHWPDSFFDGDGRS